MANIHSVFKVMSELRRNTANWLVDSTPVKVGRLGPVRADFYLDELVKHREFLHWQREAYSDCTIQEMETAISNVIAKVEKLCTEGNTSSAEVGCLVSRMLRSFDGVTKLSTWSDPSTTH